jgi:hypothetical protein
MRIFGDREQALAAPHGRFSPLRRSGYEKKGSVAGVISRIFSWPGCDPLNIVDLEERLDQQLQRPRVTDLAASRAAAMAWSRAVWSLAESAGPLLLTTSEIERAFVIANRPVFVFGAH